MPLILWSHAEIWYWLSKIQNISSILGFLALHIDVSELKISSKVL